MTPVPSYVSQVVWLPSLLRWERCQTVWADPEGRIRVWLSLLGRYLWLRYQSSEICHLNLYTSFFHLLIVGGHSDSREQGDKLVNSPQLFLVQRVMMMFQVFQASKYLVSYQSPRRCWAHKPWQWSHADFIPSPGPEPGSLFPCSGQGSLQLLGQIIQLMQQPIFWHTGITSRCVLSCFSALDIITLISCILSNWCCSMGLH